MKVQKIIRQTAITTLVMMAGEALAADSGREANNQENHGQFSARDYRFVKEAALGGMTEVRLGELAKQKGSNQTVRDFGQRMVAAHSKANDELKQIAATKGAVLPTEISHKENSEIERFEKLSGPEFDKEYGKYMVKDHQKDAKEFADAADDVKDPDLKAFAQKTHAMIEDHLRMAREMEASVK